jgi:hypothetical protein
VNSAAPKAGVIAAGTVPEVVVEDAGLAVPKGDFYEGQAPHDGRVLFLHNHPRPPLGIPVVYDPVSYFQIQLPSLFHKRFISEMAQWGKDKNPEVARL